MGIAWHQLESMLLTQVTECPENLFAHARYFPYPIPNKQVQIHQYLVIPGPACMHLFSCITHAACKNIFKLGMHILNAFFNLELTLFYLPVDAYQFGSQ